PTELQDQITSYVSATMSTEARATFESAMAENHLLTLAVEIAKAKQQQADPAASVCIAQKFIEMDASRDLVASAETAGSEVDLADSLGHVSALRLISQQWVRCSDPLSERLPDFLGGLLEDDEMAQFEKHLLSCPTCYEEACWNLEFVANHSELPGAQEAGEALQALKNAWAERHPAEDLVV
ncbi:MAG TPA: zf-HC2 domain-containing protein, partial [bacterium]|nr:zf-HC2 domain-containing protein [bacterium]